ncbi:putative B-cell receptor-associated protein [Helianthus annuus]|nr:putative B-cell receptor-associated protein [Helianthus annuus]KAJ0745803.1 putative B-cell receptor-associated protein [Helianthus annuus]
MIRLLFSLILSEMALIVIFVFKTPLRKLVIMGLDKLKRGRAPIVVKAVGSTIFVVMMSTVYSVMQIHNRRNGDDGELTPTDQILAARHLLEASLMGCSCIICYIRHD